MLINYLVLLNYNFIYVARIFEKSIQMAGTICPTIFISQAGVEPAKLWVWAKYVYQFRHRELYVSFVLVMDKLTKFFLERVTGLEPASSNTGYASTLPIKLHPLIIENYSVSTFRNIVNFILIGNSVCIFSFSS